MMIDNNKAPIIQPIKLKEYETKQSKYETVPQIPFRSVISGSKWFSGKTNSVAEYDFGYLPKLLQQSLYIQSIN
jgi:hypothetical protein